MAGLAETNLAEINLADICQDSRIACAALQAIIPTLGVGEPCSSWVQFQEDVRDRLIPVLSVFCADELSEPRAGRVRSLLPEVVRLLKLLQLDWQFWQGARQESTIAQRRSQFETHLHQMGLLLEAIALMVQQVSRGDRDDGL